ncbi:MAG: phenylalanine--tRNA ligase subunit beta, partial [Sciscionella sp.]
VDLVEEVLRLEGYNTIPSTLPAAPVGRGLSAGQRRRRAVSRALAEDGYTEVRPFPFVSPGVWDRLGLPEQDSRRNTVELLNPLDAQANALATTLVPGMLEVASRNLSRGNRDLALYAIGQVSIPMPEQAPVPQVGVAGRPSAEQLALLDAALPDQPIHVAVLMTGLAERAGWWGDGRQACWSDAVAAAHRVAAAAGETLHVRAAQHAPWHPGRCAELLIGELPIGHAGELHPKVVEEFGLPKRSVAMELNLDGIPLPEDLPAPTVSGYPPAVQDVALVVDTTVPAGEVAAQLRAGAGELLEHLALFDVYTGEQVGEGKRSLAYTLRFRADDRTLTSAEATAARDAAVAAVRKRFGATLRS